MAKDYCYIDLFAGCGGLSLGLHNAGWKGLFAIEKSPDAFKTLRHNLIEKKNHFSWPSWLPEKHLSIDTVIRDYRKHLRRLNGKLDLVVGGPPCQGFSTAGRRKENDDRNNLINSYLKFIKIVRPKAIFFENVKGFTLKFEKNKSKGIAYAKYVQDELVAMGYNVHGEMVNFAEFGIPQKRVRFILVGIRKGIAKRNKVKAGKFFSLMKGGKEEFLRMKNLPQNPTLSGAIGDLLRDNGVVPTRDRNGFKNGLYGQQRSKYQAFQKGGIITNSVDSHSFANHSPKVKKRLSDIIRRQSPNKNLNGRLREKYEIAKHTIILLDSRNQAPTITTLPDDYIHYSEARILTVREYARIQSFPDWFEFRGKYTTGGKNRKSEAPRYTQVGNAIPPLFGELSGLTLKKLL